jgi:hypothetical protein
MHDAQIQKNVRIYLFYYYYMIPIVLCSIMHFLLH